MYPTLRAEMARRRITASMLAVAIGVNDGTISRKLTGKAPITLGEAVTIKEYLETDLPLDVLFETEVA